MGGFWVTKAQVLPPDLASLCVTGHSRLWALWDQLSSLVSLKSLTFIKSLQPRTGGKVTSRSLAFFSYKTKLRSAQRASFLGVHV